MIISATIAGDIAGDNIDYCGKTLINEFNNSDIPIASTEDDLVEADVVIVL